MAWRPSEQLIGGELDNTAPGRVTGWLRFAGLTERVTLNLAGDFHRDIRGAVIRLTGDAPLKNATFSSTAGGTMQGMAFKQTGDAGDITAGRPPADHTKYPYIEWYSDQNGRVVIELRPEQVEVVGRPIPAIESDPVSRELQERHMHRFLDQLTDGSEHAT